MEVASNFVNFFYFSSKRGSVSRTSWMAYPIDVLRLFQHKAVPVTGFTFTFPATVPHEKNQKKILQALMYFCHYRGPEFEPSSLLACFITPLDWSQTTLLLSIPSFYQLHRNYQYRVWLHSFPVRSVFGSFTCL